MKVNDFLPEGKTLQCQHFLVYLSSNVLKCFKINFKKSHIM